MPRINTAYTTTVSSKKEEPANKRWRQNRNHPPTHLTALVRRFESRLKKYTLFNQQYFYLSNFAKIFCRIFPFIPEFFGFFGTHLKELGPQKSYKDERYVKRILLNLSNFEFYCFVKKNRTKIARTKMTKSHLVTLLTLSQNTVTVLLEAPYLSRQIAIAF